jgi:hypothetical protein
MKIGDELNTSVKSNALYFNTLHCNMSQYHVVLSAGINMFTHNNINAIIDTGCTRTTFNMEFLSFIRSTQPDYLTEFSTINAVGGIVKCSVGYLNVSIFGNINEYIQVSYVTLPDSIGALIGTDILNYGKLEVDVGRRVSFTRH